MEIYYNRLHSAACFCFCFFYGEIKESACNAGGTSSCPELGGSLEEEMATQCSILAWEIPWTEEPSRLQPTGSQRVPKTEPLSTH